MSRLIVNDTGPVLELNDNAFKYVYHALVKPIGEKMGDEWQADFGASAIACGTIYLDDLPDDIFNTAYRLIQACYNDKYLEQHKEQIDAAIQADPRYHT